MVEPIKKVLFIMPYPFDTAPAQRFRYEQYLSFLAQNNIEFELAPFISLSTWNILYKPGKFVQKAWGVVLAFWGRIKLMSKLKQFDLVFIHREASHVGPPVFEWLIAKVFRKKIIYDFDDAIWLPNYSEHNRFFHRLKFYKKVNYVMGWSYRISAGNDYLCQYAKQFNPNVVLNPTTVDTELMHNRVKDQATPKLVIGWTGTLTTARYLDSIIPVLQKLEQEFDFEFCVISNQAPQYPLRSFRFVPWRKETEMDDLLRFNVGIMPLEEDAWSNGKCGFKAIQYMALGIPALVSPVGVNTKIVDNGVNGFICDTPESWEKAFKQLLSDANLRTTMGAKAREKIVGNYSVLSNKANFLGLFEER